MIEVLQIDRRDAIEVWTVDRQGARNAIDARVVEALERAVDAVSRDELVRAVVLTGSGDVAFVSGADLKGLRSMPAQVRADVDARMNALTARLEALPFPVIAALNGVVIGGGAELALACDMRIAAPHASVTFKHVAMGVTPGWGGLRRLVSLVGRGAASRVLLTAQPLSAEAALRVGLIDEIAEPPATALDRALAIAQAVGACSPSAIADAKRLIALSYDVGGQPAAEEERRVFLERAESRDHAEALAAFFDKREPRIGPRTT